MGVCQCRVVMTDMLGSEHSVNVTAETLYEACGLALRAFREQGFIEDEGPTEFEVHVQPCATVHRVPASRVIQWLKSASRSPKEESLKARLRRE